MSRELADLVRLSHIWTIYLRKHRNDTLVDVFITVKDELHVKADRQTASLPLKYNMFRLGFTSSSVPFTYFILFCIRISFNLSAGTRRDKLLHCHQTVCECLVTGAQAVRALLFSFTEKVLRL